MGRLSVIFLALVIGCKPTIHDVLHNSDIDTSTNPDDDSDSDPNGNDDCGLDILFVVENSGDFDDEIGWRLEAGVRAFVSSLYTMMPKSVIRIGITTSSFCRLSTQDQHEERDCEAAESDEIIDRNYYPPTQQMNPGNGFQGRLFEYDDKKFFEFSAVDDPGWEPSSKWLRQALEEALVGGCEFDFTVAAAGYALSPHLASENSDFFRDENTVLLLIIISLGVDHTHKTDDVAQLANWIRQSKSNCGGDECIVGASIVSPDCAEASNNRNLEFLSSFGEEPVQIVGTGEYANFFVQVVLSAVKTCEQITGLSSSPFPIN